MNNKLNLHTQCAALGLAALALSVSHAHGQSFVLKEFSNLTLAIPDGDPFGLSQNTDIALPAGAHEIVGIQLTLDIAGGFNGDLYASLTHGNGFAVLLNRAGRDGANALGYDDAGFQITLADGAGNSDVHVYRDVEGGSLGGAALTGTWAPDGRAVDPAQVDVGDARTATFASFDGLDPSGRWTLYLLDGEAGDEAELRGWSLRVTYAAVPEAGAMVGWGAVGLVGFGVWRGWRRRAGRSFRNVEA